MGVSISSWINDWPLHKNSSPNMRVERAKLKSCKDDVIIAQGKRSAALGYYQAAPLGLRKGEPDAGADSRRPLRLRSRREIHHSQASRSPNPRATAAQLASLDASALTRHCSLKR